MNVQADPYVPIRTLPGPSAEGWDADFKVQSLRALSAMFGTRVTCWTQDWIQHCMAGVNCYSTVNSRFAHVVQWIYAQPSKVQSVSGRRSKEVL